MAQILADQACQGKWEEWSDIQSLSLVWTGACLDLRDGVQVVVAHKDERVRHHGI